MPRVHTFHMVQLSKGHSVLPGDASEQAHQGITVITKHGVEYKFDFTQRTGWGRLLTTCHNEGHCSSCYWGSSEKQQQRTNTQTDNMAG